VMSQLPWCYRIYRTRSSDIPITAVPIPVITAVISQNFPPLLRIKKGSPYSITERRVPELIPVLRSQPAGDVSR